MGTDAERALRGMLRTGTVASVNVANNTARVKFDDKDGIASPELHILHRCSGKNKDYWVPDIGDQVLCIFNNNDNGQQTPNLVFQNHCYYNESGTPVGIVTGIRQIANSQQPTANSKI